MKHYLSTAGLSLLLLVAACRSSEEELIFDKTADERVAEAIGNLKAQLVAPANGWVTRYQPNGESGAFTVLLNFGEDDNVRIRTDFGINDGEFYDQTVPYRIDNSLGLELIFETYSVFSFFFEVNRATYGGEFEFNYANETPDGALVFSSKNELSPPLTIMVLEPAPENAESLLGRQLSSDLATLSAGLGTISPVYRLAFANRDLSLYLSLDDFTRRISFTYATRSSGAGGQALTFSTGYTAQGNTLVLDEPLTGNFLGNDITITAINLRALTDAPGIEACGRTFNIQQYEGTLVESGEPVALLPTLFDPAGANFEDVSNIFIAGPADIYNNGVSAAAQITQDIEGFDTFVIYHTNNDRGSFYAMGYLLVLPDNNFTIPVKEFVPTYEENQIQFAFVQTYMFTNGDTTATLNEPALDTYLNNLTQGDSARILQSGPNTYELFNPCTGWSVVLQGLN